MHPHHNVSGRGREGVGKEGEPVGGLCSCGIGWMVGWLALQGWRCLKKVVPYVQKLVLSKVSVSWGVLYPDEHSLLDGPGVAVDFFVYYVELVGVHGMSCGGTVEVYGGRGFEVFLNSVT